jgi:hypothetical protein
VADEYDSIDDVLDDPSIDAQALAAMTAALAGLTYLDPSRDVVGEPMPAPVWARLDAALAEEAAARAEAAPDNVVHLVPGSGQGDRRPPRAFRWAGGLAAASVAVFAVGLAINTMGGAGTSTGIVAGAAVTPRANASDLTKMAAAPQASAFATAGGTADEAAAAAPVGPQPARMVMASSMNYTRSGLADQVTSLLDEVNVHTAAEAARMPVEQVALPDEAGFTHSWAALRECLTWLAKSTEAQALVVDRATYEGADAGVVVAPASQVDPTTSPPPTTTVDSPMGTLDVWVVKPECEDVQDGLVTHLPYVLLP